MEPFAFYNQIRSQAASYLDDDQLALVDRAFTLAEVSHRPQLRDSGEPYIIHPLYVAEYLAAMRLDASTLAAALLHDVPEDTPTTLEQIEAEFGSEIAHLVNGVTKLGQIEAPPETPEELLPVMSQAETLNKMMLAAANDIRVILIKLADRLHNMRTILALPLKRRRKVTNTTVKIFIPMAARLGVWSMKTEMEDLVMQALHPDTYAELHSLLASRTEQRQAALDNISLLLTHRLADVELPAEVSEYRLAVSEVHRLSKQLEFEISTLPDAWIVEVSVPKVKDCYQAVGVVHSLWKPVPGRFDDYIVSPKENLYRSLHTTVIGPGGKMLKVRIRTHEMSDWAKYGIFAYWRNPDTHSSLGKPEDRVRWLSQLHEWRQESTDALEFVESLMTDFLPEHIDVFSPKGKVFELPMGATALDYAYQVHTNIGHACRAARVNDQDQPLNAPLRNGDQVVILTINQPAPQYEWLNPYLGYTFSTQSKRSVRRWFRRQPRGDQITLGRHVLERELSLLGLVSSDAAAVTHMMGYHDIDELHARIGSSELYISDVAIRYVDNTLGLKKIIGEGQPVSMEVGAWVQVHGAGTLKTRLGKCCNPTPRSHIIGLMNEDGLLTVHCLECSYALHALEEGRIVRLGWKKTPKKTCPVPLFVQAVDRSELLLDFTAIISQEKLNLERVAAASDPATNRARIEAVLEIENSIQLVRILHKIDHLPNVRSVYCELKRSLP